MISHNCRNLIFGLGLLISIIFVSNLWAEENSLSLDSFEGKIDKSTVDFGAAAGSSIQVEADRTQKACGEQSLKMTYSLQEGGYMFCARGQGLDVATATWDGQPGDQVNWSEYKAISFQLMDTRENNGPIAIDIKDSGKEIWRYLINNEQKDWTKITIPLDQFKVREDWQPSTADGNRTLDFPIKSYQWEPKTPGEGVIYFDCVELSK